MRPEDLNRWVEAHRAAELREQQERRAHPLPTAVAISSALSLIAVVGRLQGWPPVESAESRREDDAAQRQWMRLRAVLGRSA